MKVITKCVIDMKTSEVIEEESYLYDGPVALLKGSSGGGSSGAVSHSLYLEQVHGDWLWNGGTDLLSQSMADTMETAFGNSPWTGLTAYDPDADIAAFLAVMAAYKAILADLDDTDDWETAYDKAANIIVPVSDAYITADVAAFGDQLDDEITTKVLPRFRRGMQDINAVVSSAFPVGEAIIEAFRDRDVAKHSSGIRIALASENSRIIMSGTEQILKLMSNRIGLEQDYMKTYIESMRIKIVAKKEQTDQDAKIDEEDALWDLEVFQYGANLLAGIQGGTASGGKEKKPSTFQSVLGGALTGAAAGAMVGNVPGAIIGGVLGAASGLL